MLETCPGAFINIGNAGSLEAAMSFTAALLFAWIFVSAIKKFEEQGQIGVTRLGGMPNCYWPLMPAALAKMSGNPVWFVNALRISGPKANDKPRAFGAATRNQSSRVDQSSGLDQSSRVDQHQSGGVDCVGSEPVNSSRRTSLVEPCSISSLISSEEEDREARKRELPDWMADSDLIEWHGLYNTWGVKPGAVNHNTADRSFTDKQLAGELRAFADTDPQILKRAFGAALNTVRAKAAESTGKAGGSAMLSYFRQVLGSEIDRRRLAGVKLEQAQSKAKKPFKLKRY
jgi:hypothetical protein